MADGVPTIPLVQVGGESLVSARLANQIIVPLNGILQGKVAPIANVGTMKYAGGQFILDLSQIDGRLKRVEAGGVSSGTSQFPFQIQNTSPNVNVRYATVSDFAPTGIAQNMTPINNTTSNIYINATISNAGAVTAVSIANTNGAVPSNSTFQAYKLIGQVTVASNVVTTINQAVNQSLEFTAVGRDTANPATTPGTYYFFPGATIDTNIQYPFQIQNTSPNIMVRYGTVNDLVMTNVATNLVPTNNATSNVYLNCTINNNGAVTSGTVTVTTAAFPSNSTFQAYKLIGQVTLASGVVTAINQAVTHSLGFYACNRNTTAPDSNNMGTYEFWGV